MQLEVRNAGQGGGCGDSYDNQVWCLNTLVGESVDVIHYSWTYFEVGRDDVAAYHEMFYRWSLLLEGSPVPQILHTGNCSDDFRADDAALLERYGHLGANIVCMTRGLEAAGYPGKEWGVVGDTLHATTRYGEDPNLDPTRRTSLGVVFRNWHPGPLLFQTIADALAYHYAESLLIAAAWIEAEADPRSRWPQATSTLRVADLPEPHACDPEWCSADDPPLCAYYSAPRFGEQQVELVGEPTRAVDGDFEPGSSPASGWRVVRAAPDLAMPPAERALPECAHPNFCGGIQAVPQRATDWLRFRLPPVQRGRIELCCGAKRCGQTLLEKGAEFEIDGRWKPRARGASA